MKKVNLKKASTLSRDYDQVFDNIQKLEAIETAIKNGAEINVDINVAGEHIHGLKLKNIEKSIADEKKRLIKSLTDIEAEIEAID